jgi:hypothetical protein
MRASPSSHPSRVRRPVTAATCALVITALTSGCGFVDVLAHPDTPPAVPSTPPTPSTATASASPAPVASAAGDLVGSSDGRPATLDVSVGAVQRGVPHGLLPEDCGLAADATEYTTVTVIFTNRSQPTKQTGVSSNLRLDLTVAGGSGLGLIAVAHTTTTYCEDASVLPPRTTLQSLNLAEEHQTMTVHVVARTGPADPEALRGVSLQLRDPRHHPDIIDPQSWTWEVERVTAGSTCPDDPNSLCVPLS